MRKTGSEVLENARLHVRRWFAAHVPRPFLFHDLEHTLSVTRAAVGLGRSMRLTPNEMFLLELAALFHDTGYALAYEGHEEKSAGLAASFLAKQGLNDKAIAQVSRLIMATRVSVQPRGKLQKVLRDADSSKAGQVDFGEKSESLRKELDDVRGIKVSERDWLRQNLSYLDAHRFYTAHAQRRYGTQKAINQARLRVRLDLPKKALKQIEPVEYPWFDRDLSWLSFNDRVLQEAKDPRNPLLERVKFLAIYSSNLDEFYRVRVASLRSLSKLKKNVRTALEIPAEKLIARINKKALKQQQEFGALWRGTLLPAMARKGVHLLKDDQLNKEQTHFVRDHFTKHVAPLLSTASVRPGNAPFIEDRRLYFVVRLRHSPKGKRKERLVLVNIPSETLGRFMVLPARGKRVDILFLDDAIRLCLEPLFTGHKVLGCHSIKLSRDAELYLDEEFVGNVKDKVRKSLRKRLTGMPSRFLYDASMPQTTIRALRSLLGLTKADMVPGGRYHNFNDLMKLPVKGRSELHDKPWPAWGHPNIPAAKDLFSAVGKKDLMLHFPYQDFGLVTQWLELCAGDPKVVHIAITLYRVAEASAVCGALLLALEKGKKVTVFVEVQARFDEGTNLFWGEQLEKAGATVMYSYEHLKVHCKLCLVERSEGGRTRRYAYLGTGNFNEGTSRNYSDSAMITARDVLTREVADVFAHLADRRVQPVLTHILMAPLLLRSRLEALIDKEIENAMSGKPASILLKLNSLEDRAMITKLYDAGRSGVHVRLIIRGICCLVPGVSGISDNIEAISIVDRYLEHARAYVFGNDGKPVMYLSSADWMERNLDHRVEVAFPVLDPDLFAQYSAMLELQWFDNVKARTIDVKQTNPYRRSGRSKAPVHAQRDTHALLKTSMKKVR